MVEMLCHGEQLWQDCGNQRMVGISKCHAPGVSSGELAAKLPKHLQGQWEGTMGTVPFLFTEDIGSPRWADLEDQWIPSRVRSRRASSQPQPVSCHPADCTKIIAWTDMGTFLPLGLLANCYILSQFCLCLPSVHGRRSTLIGRGVPDPTLTVPHFQGWMAPIVFPHPH
jgi:hypothetical protein